MKRIIINGPTKLNGDITVSGSKNAALPIIFATLLTYGTSEIENLPDIGDVRVALEIIERFGAKVTRLGKKTYINTETLSYIPTPDSLLSAIRASTYLIGSCLSRFGECAISSFGGCNFSHRPIDMHLYAAALLGAEICDGNIVAGKLKGAHINFSKPSVGATVNAILLAACAEGNTVIRGFAKEPHIDALVDFLISAGASIKLSDTEIFISGKRLHGGKITVIGDMIEAGSYLTAGIITSGRVTVNNCPLEDMYAYLNAISDFGAKIEANGDSVTATLKDRGARFDVTAAPYPDFPTDLQPIIAPLMAYGSGGRITDTVWQSRFGYLDSLASFGIASSRKDNAADIYPSSIHSATVTSPDLRGGMACIISALVANGRSVINSADIVLRGYERLEEKMRSLGADITIQEF